MRRFILIGAMVCLFGFFMWEIHWEREYEKIVNEKLWWQEQCNLTLKDRARLKLENDWYKKILESRKKGDYLWIAEMYEETITEMYKEWKRNSEIAKLIGCSTSTIQRATYKRWLRDKYWKGRKWRR